MGGDGGGRAVDGARAHPVSFFLSLNLLIAPLSLSFPPSLPLALGLGPAALASLAAAWPDAGVGVSLTGGVLQIVAATAYSVGGVGPGAGKHEWAYKLTVRLLGGEVTATAAQGAAGGSGGAEAWPTDEQGTWPPHLHAGEDEEGEDGEALPAPLPPGGLPPVAAATLLRRRWVTRDVDGAVLDVLDGPGVVGLTPRLVAGAPPPFFSYSSRSGGFLSEPEVCGGYVNPDVLPGTVKGSLEGALQFEGEPVGGGRPFLFWARVPTMQLRVPVWRF